MNDEPSQFDRLVERARLEQPPAVDVSARVQISLQARVQPVSFDWPLIIAAALSVSAALLVMAAAGYQHSILSDPIAQLFLPLTPTIQ